MRRLKAGLYFGILLSAVWISPVGAGAPGTSSGLVLLRTTGARPSALGDAFTAVTDDIHAFKFNPGSLATLSREHVSLQYQSGFDDDAFSHASLGMRAFNGGIGISAGNYDSGKTKLFDGTNIRELTAEEDWVVNLGYGSTLGKMAVGTSVRYLSSKLAETYSDSAMSVDLGFQVPLFSQLRFGLSGPLFQTKLKYGQTEEDLPKVYRAGFASNVNLNLATGRQPLLLVLDVPYDADADHLSVAGGAETYFGPLALRIGSNGGMDLSNVSFGAGFTFARFTVDYTFGLIQSGFDSTHNVNFSMRFGQETKI